MRARARGQAKDFVLQLLRTLHEPDASNNAQMLAFLRTFQLLERWMHKRACITQRSAARPRPHSLAHCSPPVPASTRMATALSYMAGASGIPLPDADMLRLHLTRAVLTLAEASGLSFEDGELAAVAPPLAEEYCPPRPGPSLARTAFAARTPARRPLRSPLLAALPHCPPRCQTRLRCWCTTRRSRPRGRCRCGTTCTSAWMRSRSWRWCGCRCGRD